jgi:gas vesicle protein
LKYHFFSHTGRNSRAKKRGQLGAVVGDCATQLLRPSDSKFLKRHSEMKSQMKREALEKMNRHANATPLDSGTEWRTKSIGQSDGTARQKMTTRIRSKVGTCFRIYAARDVGA